MFPVLWLLAICDLFMFWDFRADWRNYCALISLLLATFMMSINYYWYMLILKGLKRLLEHAGILSKGKLIIQI